MLTVGEDDTVNETLAVCETEFVPLTVAVTDPDELCVDVGLCVPDLVADGEAVFDDECEVVTDTEFDTVGDGEAELDLDTEGDEVDVLVTVVVIDVFGVTVDEPLLEEVLELVEDAVLVLVSVELGVESIDVVGVRELDRVGELEEVEEGDDNDDRDERADRLGRLEKDDVVLSDNDPVDDTDDVTDGLADADGLALLDGLAVSEGIEEIVGSGDTVCDFVAKLDLELLGDTVDDLETVLVFVTGVVGVVVLETVDVLVCDVVADDVLLLDHVGLDDEEPVGVLVVEEDIVPEGLGVIVFVGKVGKDVVLGVEVVVPEIDESVDRLGEGVPEDVLEEVALGLDVVVDFGDC